MINKLNKSLILFDGDCCLCNALVQFVIKKDTEQKFLFAPLQSNIGQTFLINDGLPTNHFYSFVFIKGNKYYKKSTAGLTLLKDIGGIWKLFYIFMLIPKPVRDCIYDLIAKNRFRIFGRQKHCIEPSSGLKQQFLD